MAKVSILMNGYNAQEYLKEAIDSIYRQSYSDWEIIFIDNCSTDNTKNIVDSYDDKIYYYKTEKNIPLGAARNFGLKYCKGEYTAFLDTDDIWLENKLMIQVELMDMNIKCQLCYGGVIYIDAQSKASGTMMPIASSNDIFSQQLKRYEINMQSVLLRNNETLRFNESLKHSPDFDLFMNIILNTEACVVKEFLVKYRVQENSLTAKNIDIWWSEMKFTLDRIFSENIGLKERYLLEYNAAYAKVAYKKAQYLISINKKSDASRELSRFKFINYKYFILFISSKLPINVWYFIHKYK